MAPLPTSPHINVFEIQGTSIWPQFFNFVICSFVAGWPYTLVFMAGQNKSGLLKSQARVVHRRRLSRNPMDLLANEFIFICEDLYTKSDVFTIEEVLSTFGYNDFNHKFIRRFTIKKSFNELWQLYCNSTPCTTYDDIFFCWFAHIAGVLRNCFLIIFDY